MFYRAKNYACDPNLNYFRFSETCGHFLTGRFFLMRFFSWNCQLNYIENVKLPMTLRPKAVEHCSTNKDYFFILFGI